jgi:hypothetical protein
MSFATRTFAGLAMMIGGVGGLAFGIYKLASIGTCASGGPYLSARPCPSNTGLFVVLITGGVFVFLIGGWVFSGRGRTATAPGLPESDRMTDNPPPVSGYPTNRT